MTALSKNHARGAGYLAAQHIYNHDRRPIPLATLITIIDFGVRESTRKEVLKRAVDTGWLVEIEQGIGIPQTAIDYLDAQEKPKRKFVGKVAAPRVPVPMHLQPELSRKHIPSRHANRDTPEFAERATPHFYTKA